MGKNKLGLITGSEWKQIEDAFDHLLSQSLSKSSDAKGPVEALVEPSKMFGYSLMEDIGESLTNLHFGSYEIEIYKNGFVKVSSMYGLRHIGLEKLVDIEGESQITKKTGLGRALGAAFTLGVNMAGPSQRGNLILTITTDKQVHVLTHDVPFDHDIENVNKIVSTGRAVIRVRDTASKSPKNSNPHFERNLVEQVKELLVLKDSGAISEEEFVLMKQRLISES